MWSSIALAQPETHHSQRLTVRNCAKQLRSLVRPRAARAAALAALAVLLLWWLAAPRAGLAVLILSSTHDTSDTRGLARQLLETGMARSDVWLVNVASPPMENGDFYYTCPGPPREFRRPWFSSPR